MSQQQSVALSVHASPLSHKTERNHTGGTRVSPSRLPVVLHKLLGSPPATTCDHRQWIGHTTRLTQAAVSLHAVILTEASRPGLTPPRGRSRDMHATDEHSSSTGSPAPAPVELLDELGSDFPEQFFNLRLVLRFRQVVGHVLVAFAGLQLHPVLLHGVLDPEPLSSTWRSLPKPLRC